MAWAIYWVFGPAEYLNCPMQTVKQYQLKLGCKTQVWVWHWRRPILPLHLSPLCRVRFLVCGTIFRVLHWPPIWQRGRVSPKHRNKTSLHNKQKNNAVKKRAMSLFFDVENKFYDLMNTALGNCMLF